MFYGVYSIAIAVMILIGLFAILLRVNPHGRWRNPRSRILGYVGTAVLVALLGIVLFTALAAWVGLMALGVVQDFNFPADFMNAGAAGWGLLALLALLVLSPLALATRFARPDKKLDKFGKKKTTR
ncbi:MAG TPA: hypothetical protein VFF68_11560 [Anaerolineaceae bacterium]|nr:hypothetical protein [Anaerolineaceae bacterium]